MVQALATCPATGFAHMHRRWMMVMVMVVVIDIMQIVSITIVVRLVIIVTRLLEADTTWLDMMMMFTTDAARAWGSMLMMATVCIFYYPEGGVVTRMDEEVRVMIEVIIIFH